MARLYVNVDHVATVRQARRALIPDPVVLAAQAEEGGAEGITVHLREDRRHIQDDDVRRLKASVRTPLNLELSLAAEIVRFAADLNPEQLTFVPERREEITTEGGLDVDRHGAALEPLIAEFQKRGIIVSLFIDPDEHMIRRAAALGAGHVELHTGRYAHGIGAAKDAAFAALAAAAADAMRRGLVVNAGHGLDYCNTNRVAAIAGIQDLNIGHAIVARALEVGMRAAVREMRGIVKATMGD